MKKEIIIIVAVAQNNVIGRNNTLPWRLPADLKHFKTTTMGHCILMGRKTFESFPKVLDGRTSVIITRNKDFNVAHPSCIVANDLLSAVGKSPCQKIYIIGGGEIYQQVLHKELVDRLIITEIKSNVEGDTFFPSIDFNNWREEQRFTYKKDAQNPYDFDIVYYKRLSS